MYTHTHTKKERVLHSALLMYIDVHSALYDRKHGVTYGGGLWAMAHPPVFRENR